MLQGERERLGQGWECDEGRMGAAGRREKEIQEDPLADLLVEAGVEEQAHETSFLLFYERLGL